MTLDIDRLLSELTLEEKASLTSGSAFWYTAPVERLGIPKIMVSDGPHGLRAQPGEGDHVGIGGSLPATCFPTASAIASSWNPELLRRVGEALGREARACNLSVILGPGINMKRSPLCGRNFEYLAEDPYLTGELAVGIIDGIQSQGVGTSVKHYAANNQEDDRLRVDAQVDERTLREIYLPAFERVVKATQPWTIMCSYNKVNGVSASENIWLLTTVLREEWGYRGVVVSDWGAVYHRVPALLAGLDLEMPPALGRSPESVVAAVKSGEVAVDVLDTRVRTMLELVAKGIPVLELDESFDRGGPPRAGARGGRRVGGAARQRRHAAPGPGREHCRDRRVRPYAAVPGRRVLSGQPDPRRHDHGRADLGVWRHPLRRGLRDRGHR